MQPSPPYKQPPTTQAGIRNVFDPGKRKLRQRTDHLKYPHLKMTMYSDTLWASKCTATGGHIGAQVYTNGGGYDYFIPIKRKGDAYTTLQTLAEITGASQVMATDGDGALRGEETWLKECRRLGMRDKITVPYSSWQNLAEASIRELKCSVRRAMRRSGSQHKLWNFCCVWCAAIRRLTSMDKLDGRTPTEVVTGTTPDISQYAQIDWYEPIRFLDNLHTFPNETKLLGRFLGVAEHCTDVTAFRILTEIGTILTRKSVRAITDAEKRGDQYQAEIAKFDLGTASGSIQIYWSISKTHTSSMARTKMNQWNRSNRQCSAPNWTTWESVAMKPTTTSGSNLASIAATVAKFVRDLQYWWQNCM
jgi:hypothetical protein